MTRFARPHVRPRLRVADLADATRALAAVLDELEINQTTSTPSLSAWANFALTQTDEEHRPYDRPPLSKQILVGEMQPEEIYYKCDDLDIDWMLGHRAVGLDVARLEGGEEVSYDGLIIATGRRARGWPDLPDLEGVHMIRTLDDSLDFKKAAAGCSRVAIVGAGFIGCEVAASLRKQGVGDVTLIDIADQPMLPIGEEAGEFARRIHESEGVRFKLGAKVEGFDEADGHVSAVRLVGEDPVEAEVVLLALGSVPNSEWLEGSGLELFQGNVRCDEYCFATEVGDIVAAGDIAAWPHPHAGDEGLAWIEHWMTAREMATAAAKNLVTPPAEREPFATVPSFWSDQYDVKIKSAGLLKAADTFDVLECDEEKRRLVVEARRGDELVGAIVFNKNKAFIDYQRKLRATLAAAL